MRGAELRKILAELRLHFAVRHVPSCIEDSKPRTIRFAVHDAQVGLRLGNLTPPLAERFCVRPLELIFPSDEKGARKKSPQLRQEFSRRCEGHGQFTVAAA